MIGAGRPSEAISAAVGSIVGAIAAILTGYGVNLPQGVEAAVVVLVGWVASVVTYFVAKRQASGKAWSNADGKVGPPK